MKNKGIGKKNLFIRQMREAIFWLWSHGRRRLLLCMRMLQVFGRRRRRDARVIRKGEEHTFFI